MIYNPEQSQDAVTYLLAGIVLVGTIAGIAMIAGVTGTL